MSERRVRFPKRPRSVGTRILVSYFVVLSVFGAASAFCVTAFRAASHDAALLRDGYLPLALSLRDLVAQQDTWNSQLNHVTDARNPADKRVWFETALRVGRPRAFGRTEALLERARRESNPDVAATFDELAGELEIVRRLTEPDRELSSELFSAIERGDQSVAEARRDALVGQGLRVQRALRGLENRVTEHVDGIFRVAKARESLALTVLVLLGVLTMLTGVLMALYASRVLRPLSQVTRRAQSVARGDLTKAVPLDTGDELGELSTTFEKMVEAIDQARERLLASERLAAIGKMAAHVTHEVRNPLSSIALNLELLEDELPAGSEEARVLLRAIGLEVERLGVLSDQYLSMARRRAPELEEASLREVVESAVEFVRRDLEKNGVELHLELGDEEFLVGIDPAQIRQALFNLLRNAREAMPGGGSVWVRLVGEQEFVRVDVEDDGPGVPEERVAMLFDPFFTTKDHGTGLGLAVTRQIVVAHGGRLDYATRPGRGSRFSLSLPLVAPETAPEPTESS